MMERFLDAEFSWHCCPQKTVTIPRSVIVLYLLFTQPSLIRSFHSSDPCFSVSCPKGVGYARVYCSTFGHYIQAQLPSHLSSKWPLIKNSCLRQVFDLKTKEFSYHGLKVINLGATILCSHFDPDAPPPQRSLSYTNHSLSRVRSKCNTGSIQREAYTKCNTGSI